MAYSKHHIVLSKFLVLLVLLCSAVSLHAQLAVNEFNCQRGFTDENGDDVDWVEVFNYSSDSVFLADYYLSDNPNNLDKWQFPNVYLGSQELITICASGRENLELSNHWESIVLATNTWKYWTSNTPPPDYGNWNTQSFNDQNWNTGQGGVGYSDNDDNTIIASTPSILLRKEFQIADIDDITHLLFHADYDDGFIAYLNGVEIMRSNNFANFSPSYNEFTSVEHEAVLYTGGIPEHQLFKPEEVHELLTNGTNLLAIRVHNASASSSDMSSNFFLSAGISSTNYNYQTLPSWIIPPLVLPHADFKLSHGETISISDSNENVIDSVFIPFDITHTISKGRIPDGVGNWCYFNTPSPNLSNDQNTCFSGIVTSPVLDLPSGWYQAPNQVNVSTSANATSYYTTNGDVPGVNDNVVNGPIYIYSTTVLSVRSFNPNGQMLPSAIVDRTYVIDEENHNLPVVSIITDEDNLWDWNSGIYVSGPNATTNYPYFGSNFWQPWSRKSRMEFFDASRVKQFEAQFDLEIHGGWSRAEPQKSFRIDAKSIYTGDIEYALIERKPAITQYNNFNIRNGGQHGASDRIQDAVISRLGENTHIDRMGYQPCIVYLNGAYWGLYGIREKIDEHYVESNHGISSKDIDLLNWDGALAGSADHFAQSYSMIQNTVLSDPNFVDVLSTRFDIDNYIDYFIFQTYIQNMDWLGIAWGLNNIKLWRPDTAGGKWRYVLYDTDAAWGHFGQNIYQNYLALARNPSSPNAHSAIFNRALNNNAFKCRFTNRYDDLINTTFQPNNVNIIVNELKASIQLAIPDHIATWNNQMGPYSYTGWEYDVNDIKLYNSARISTARQHINESLSLQGQKQVSLDALPESSGHVQMNSILPSLPWSGIYHGGCPVTAKAIPGNGFTFSHWYSTAPAYNNLNIDSIEIALASNTTLIAHFDTCKNVIDVDILPENKNLRASISDDLSGVSYEWFLNGTVVSSDSIIYNPIDGNYQLTIRFDSCEIESEVFTLENGDYRLHLFPNPAINALNVQFLIGEQEDLSIRILNTLGQVVQQWNYPGFIGQYNESIDVSGLARELYFIQIETPNKVYTEKFILID